MRPGTPVVTARNTATSAFEKSWACGQVAVGELCRRRAEDVGEERGEPEQQEAAHRTPGRTPRGSVLVVRRESTILV